MMTSAKVRPSVREEIQEGFPNAVGDEGGGEEKVPEEGESSSSTEATATNVPMTTTTACAVAVGADTHVVGFEGAQDKIVVVAKKATLWWFLFSPGANEVIDSAFETFMLTPIFAVSAILSVIGLMIALVHDIEDKQWYWVFACSGVWQPLVSKKDR